MKRTLVEQPGLFPALDEEAARAREAEFYATPEGWPVRGLIEAADPPLRFDHVVEPCVGEGHMVRHVVALVPSARRWSFCEIRSEAAERAANTGRELGLSFSEDVGDFLKGAGGNLELATLVITNPPFSLAAEFLVEAVRRAPLADVALLVRQAFFASGERSALVRSLPLDRYDLAERPSFTGDGNDKWDYTWAVTGPERGGRWFSISRDPPPPVSCVACRAAIRGACGVTCKGLSFPGSRCALRRGHGHVAVDFHSAICESCVAKFWEPAERTGLAEREARGAATFDRLADRAVLLQDIDAFRAEPGEVVPVRLGAPSHVAGGNVSPAADADASRDVARPRGPRARMICPRCRREVTHGRGASEPRPHKCPHRHPCSDVGGCSACEAARVSPLQDGDASKSAQKEIENGRAVRGGAANDGGGVEPLGDGGAREEVAVFQSSGAGCQPDEPPTMAAVGGSDESRRADRASGSGAPMAGGPRLLRAAVEQEDIERGHEGEAEGGGEASERATSEAPTGEESADRARTGRLAARRAEEGRRDAAEGNGGASAGAAPTVSRGDGEDGRGFQGIPAAANGGGSAFAHRSLVDGGALDGSGRAGRAGGGEAHFLGAPVSGIDGREAHERRENRAAGEGDPASERASEDGKRPRRAASEGAKATGGHRASRGSRAARGAGSGKGGRRARSADAGGGGGASLPGDGEPSRCGFCGCDDHHSCNLGGDRRCFWADTGFTRCSACHELLEAAELLSDSDAATVEALATALFEVAHEAKDLICVLDEVGEGWPFDALRLRRIAGHEIARRGALVPEQTGPALEIPPPVEAPHLVEAPEAPPFERRELLNLHLFDRSMTAAEEDEADARVEEWMDQVEVFDAVDAAKDAAELAAELGQPTDDAAKPGPGPASSAEEAPAARFEIPRCGDCPSGLPTLRCALLAPHPGVGHVSRATLDRLRVDGLRGYPAIAQGEIRAAWAADEDEQAVSFSPSDRGDRAGGGAGSGPPGGACAPRAEVRALAGGQEEGRAPTDEQGPDACTSDPVIGLDTGATTGEGSRVGHANESRKVPSEHTADGTADGRGTEQGPRDEERDAGASVGVAVDAGAWAGFRAGNSNRVTGAGKHPASKRNRGSMNSRRKGPGESQKQASSPGEIPSGVSNGDCNASPSAIGDPAQNKNPWDQRGTADPKTGDPSPTAGPDAGPDAGPPVTAHPSSEPARTGGPLDGAELRGALVEVGEEALPLGLVSAWGRFVVPALVMVTTRRLWRMFEEHLFASWELRAVADLARALSSLYLWPDLRRAIATDLEQARKLPASGVGSIADQVARDLARIGYELARATLYEPQTGEVPTRVRARAVAYALGYVLREEPQAARHVLLPESEHHRNTIARFFLTADHVRATVNPRELDPAVEAAMLAWLGERPWNDAWSPEDRVEVHHYIIDRLIVLAGMMQAPKGLARPAPLLADYEPNRGDA